MDTGGLFLPIIQGKSGSVKITQRSRRTCDGFSRCFSSGSGEPKKLRYY